MCGDSCNRSQTNRLTVTLQLLLMCELQNVLYIPNITTCGFQLHNVVRTHVKSVHLSVHSSVQILLQ